MPWRDFPSLYHADAPLHKGTIFLGQLQEGENSEMQRGVMPKALLSAVRYYLASLLMSRPQKQ